MNVELRVVGEGNFDDLRRILIQVHLAAYVRGLDEAWSWRSCPLGSI